MENLVNADVENIIENGNNIVGWVDEIRMFTELIESNYIAIKQLETLNLETDEETIFDITMPVISETTLNKIKDLLIEDLRTTISDWNSELKHAKANLLKFI